MLIAKSDYSMIWLFQQDTRIKPGSIFIMTCTGTAPVHPLMRNLWNQLCGLGYWRGGLTASMCLAFIKHASCATLSFTTASLWNSSRYLLTKQRREGNPPCSNRHKIVYCSVCTAEYDFSAVFIKKMMTKFSSGLRKTCRQTWKSQCICNWKCACLFPLSLRCLSSCKFMETALIFFIFFLACGRGVDGINHYALEMRNVTRWAA